MSVKIIYSPKLQAFKQRVLRKYSRPTTTQPEEIKHTEPDQEIDYHGLEARKSSEEGGAHITRH
jgi:hypothetical protein